MTNYLVRIYHKADNNRRILAGVVEEAGVEGNKAFSNLGELWSILNSSMAKAAKPKKSTKSLKH